MHEKNPTPGNKVLSTIIAQYNQMEKNVKSAAYKFAHPYFIKIIRQKNQDMYQSLSFQTGIASVVKDLSPKQFLDLLKNMQVYRPACSPFLSEHLNTEIDNLFAQNIARVYLKTRLDLNRRDVKLHETVLHQLESFDKEQLQKLIQQMAQNKTHEMPKEICLALQATDTVENQQQKIKTHRLVQTLATLGAIATLTFGGTHASTKEQKAAVTTGAVALTAVAIGAHMNKKKWRIQNAETTACLQKQPEVFSRFQQIQTIIHNHGRK